MAPFFIYLLKSGGILTIFYLIYKLLLQKETFFISNRLFLIIGIVGSIVIPFIIFTKTVYLEPLALNNLSNVADSNAIVPGEKVTIWAIFFVVYIIGVAIFFFRFILQVLSFVRIVKESKIIKEDGYKYVQTKKEISPFSFLNFIVFNPGLYSESDLNIIIQHEKIHTHQKHSLDILLVNFLIIFQWMNPIAWLYKKAIEQNLEFLADEKTSQNISCKKSYQYLLLQQVTVNHLSITNTFFNHLIKKRIVMLNKNKSKKQSIWKYALILPLLIAFVLAFNTKTVAQTTTADKNVEVTGYVNNQSRNIGYMITKNSTDGYLEKIREEINNNEGELKIENLKRNARGVITNIKINYTHGTNNMVSSFSDKKGIQDIAIGYNHEKNVFIGANNSYTETSINNDTDTEKTLSITTHKINFEEGDPLHILDGKVISKEKFEEIVKTVDQIEKVEVLKGEKAIEEYEKAGKNGVIIITTKK